MCSLITVLGSLGRLAALALAIIVDKDWIAVLANGDEAKLARKIANHSSILSVLYTGCSVYFLWIGSIRNELDVSVHRSGHQHHRTASDGADHLFHFSFRSGHDNCFLERHLFRRRAVLAAENSQSASEIGR